MKILASDYDNTLKRGSIDINDIRAIEKFRSENNLFGIVTGRSLLSIKEEIIKHQIPVDFVVGLNGGIITDHNFQVLDKYVIEPAIVPEVLNYILSNSKMVGFYGNQYQTLKFSSLEKKGIYNETGAILNEVLNFGVIVNQHEYLMPVYLELKQRFSDYLSFHQNGDRLIDISKVKVDKATGIARIMALLRLHDELYVVGDSYNDIPMIEAYQGFAMVTGKEEVKNLATCVFQNFTEMIGYIDARKPKNK